MLDFQKRYRISFDRHADTGKSAHAHTNQFILMYVFLKADKRNNTIKSTKHKGK